MSVLVPKTVSQRGAIEAKGARGWLRGGLKCDSAGPLNPDSAQLGKKWPRGIGPGGASSA